MIDKRTKRNLLIVAIGIAVIAIVWLVALECNSSIRVVCGRINQFGYNVTPDDFMLQGYSSESAIADVLNSADGASPENIERIRQHSIQCGFNADIERTGRVELLLWNIDDNQVMYVYTVNGEAELVFIEDIAAQTTRPIG